MNTNLTCYIIDQWPYYTMKFDPRAEYRKMFTHSQVKLFGFSEIADVLKSDQSMMATRDTYLRKMTVGIRKGKLPERLLLKDPYVLVPGAHYVRANDVLAPGFRWYLSWMMDTGIVRKLYSPFYMTNGKSFTKKITIWFVAYWQHICFSLPDEIRFHRKRTLNEAAAVHDSLKLEMFYVVFGVYGLLMFLTIPIFLLELIVYKCRQCTSKDMVSSRNSTPVVVIQNADEED